jgi:hypothetical protein
MAVTNPIIIMNPTVLTPQPLPARDSKKTPPNALLRNPYTGEVAPCLVRDLFKSGSRGKITYIVIKRVNVGGWTDMFGLAEQERITVLRRHHPIMLEMVGTDYKTPDYFAGHSFVPLRFVSWRFQNNTQRIIHAAIVDPLRYAELLEEWREKRI